MAKTYLRVAHDWTKLFDPREKIVYMMNISGNPIQLLFTDTTTLPKHPYPFTLGGTIGQITAAFNKYVYARAAAEDTEGVVICSDTTIDLHDTETMQSEMDLLGREIIKLTQRVTKTELKNVEQSVNYRTLLRQFLEGKNKMMAQVANLNLNDFKLLSRLFNAEMLIYQFRTKVTNLDALLSNLQDVLKYSQDLGSLTVKITGISAEVAALSNKLNYYVPLIDKSYADYSKMIEREVTPLKSQVSRLDANFSSLNNSLITLGSNHSATEIEQAFTALESSVPADELAAVEMIKENLVSIANNTAKNAEQDDVLDNKVNNSDTVILASTGAELGKIQEDLDKNLDKTSADRAVADNTTVGE